MGKIIQIKEDLLINSGSNVPIYPITSAKAVYYKDGNHLLKKIDDIQTTLSTKLNKLTAGSGILIDSNNVISATGGGGQGGGLTPELEAELNKVKNKADKTYVDLQLGLCIKEINTTTLKKEEDGSINIDSNAYTIGYKKNDEGYLKSTPEPTVIGVESMFNANGYAQLKYVLRLTSNAGLTLADTDTNYPSLRINIGSGLNLSSNILSALALTLGSGLENTSGGLAVLLSSESGLQLKNDGLALKLGSNLSIGVGNKLTVNAYSKSETASLIRTAQSVIPFKRITTTNLTDTSTGYTLNNTTLYTGNINSTIGVAYSSVSRCFYVVDSTNKIYYLNWENSVGNYIDGSIKQLPSKYYLDTGIATGTPGTPNVNLGIIFLNILNKTLYTAIGSNDLIKIAQEITA